MYILPILFYDRVGGIDMNFDTKYLIRWGIPGWVLIIFVCTMYAVREFNKINDLNLNIGNVVSFVVLIGFLGVTIGYLMHQIYFSFNWNGTNNKQKRIIDDVFLLIKDREDRDTIKSYNNHNWGENYHKDYYLYEFHWHKFLLDLGADERIYMEERYRHLLSTIHALGALRTALSTSLIVNILIVFITYESGELLKPFLIPFLILLTNAYLRFVAHKGFSYYSANLNHFQGYFFDSYFKSKKEDNKENEEQELWGVKMKRDLNLVREIMLLIENNDDRRELNIPEEWDREVVAYHLKLLDQAGYVKNSTRWADNKPFLLIATLTWDGHEFLDSVKNSGIWNETKESIKKKGLELGSVPLDIVKDVAVIHIKSLFGID